MAQLVALRPLFEVFASETGYKRGERRREAWWIQEAKEKNFGPPWQTHGKLRGRGLVRRWAHSRNRNWKGEGGRGGQLACWEGDKRRPCRRMNSCGRQRCRIGGEGRPGEKMNPCGSYGGY